MAKPPPRAEFRGGFATKFRRPKRNFVAASPRNFGGRNVISWRRHEIRRARRRWRHPCFHPYSAVVSDIGPCGLAVDVLSCGRTLSPTPSVQ